MRRQLEDPQGNEWGSLCHSQPCKALWGAGPALGRPFPSLTHRQLVNVLLHFDFGSFEPLPQHLVVAGGHIHELHAPLLQVGDLQGRGDPAGLSLGVVCARSISWDGQCQDTDAFPWQWPTSSMGTWLIISLGHQEWAVPSPGTAESCASMICPAPTS